MSATRTHPVRCEQMQRSYVDRMKYCQTKSALSEQIVLRLPPALRDKIEHAAAAEGRSLANLTRRVLEQWVAERDGGQSSEAA